MRSVFFLFLLVALTFQSHANRASSVFRAKTDDLTVNDKCETYKPSYFLAEEIEYFLVGIEGFGRAGFDEEIAVTRDEAKVLWAALNPHSKASKVESALKKIKRNEKLSEYLRVLEKGKVERAAEYYSEGEILEILAYEYLPSSETFKEMLVDYFGDDGYTKNDFFITGGVTYHSKSGQTVGELDVIVGDSNTCSIFAIAEAKLGGKKGKALRQLERIRQFLRSL